MVPPPVPLEEAVALLRHEVDELRSELRSTQEALQTLASTVPLEFTVVQYNILAGYLGQNTQPWFLYGLDLNSPEGAERRRRILQKYYERDAAGRLLHKGWPKYVKGILAPEEVGAVERYDEEFFRWEVRSERLLEQIARMNADIISLVECDHFDDFFQPAMGNRGYSGVFRKRPRASSHDGCAIFWKHSKFELVSYEGMDFIDTVDPATGSPAKDRCALLALLRSKTHHRKHIIAISVHLARNPEDLGMDRLRAKQVAQVFRLLSEFASRCAAIAPTENTAVVMCGDLNATNFAKLRGLSLALAAITSTRVHPFVWDAQDVPTCATSVTTSRSMRIDALLFQASRLKLVNKSEAPQLNEPIPNAIYPSDHLPLRSRFQFKSVLDREVSLARAWFRVMTDQSLCDTPPLTIEELRALWVIFDWNHEGQFTHAKLRRVSHFLGLHLDAAMEDAIFEKMREAAVELRRRATDDSRGGDVDEARVDFDRFCAAYDIAIYSMRNEQLPELIEAFKAFDENGDGRITAEELVNVLKECSPVPISFTSDMGFESLGDGTGSVAYREFARSIIQRRRLDPLASEVAMGRRPSTQPPSATPLSRLVAAPAQRRSPIASPAGVGARGLCLAPAPRWARWMRASLRRLA